MNWAPVSTGVKTSIVVLTYRRVHALLAVLRALAPQCNAACEVLVADDGSPPEDLAALQRGMPRFGCPVRHVWHPDTGFTAARARNLAVLASSGERLIFLDGDCVPNPRFLAMHARLSRPGEFVNGSRVLLSQHLTAQVEGGSIDMAKAGLAQWLSWRRRGDVNKWLHLWQWPGVPGRTQTAFRWQGIRSCNLAVWRDDFLAVNGFEEQFSGWGHEDADLVLRLHEQGIRRCNGFLATEVFHLWHPENSRIDASRNRDRVLERLLTHQKRAELGLDQGAGAAAVRITRLN